MVGGRIKDEGGEMKEEQEDETYQVGRKFADVRQMFVFHSKDSPHGSSEQLNKRKNRSVELKQGGKREEEGEGKQKKMFHVVPVPYRIFASLLFPFSLSPSDLSPNFMSCCSRLSLPAD